MSIAESMIRQAREKAGQRLDEPVVDAVLVNRLGTLSAIVASTAFGLATDGSGGAWVAKDGIHRAGAKPTPLPPAFMVAVTTTQIHVFTVSMFMGRLKVKKEIGAFERAGLQVAVEDTSLVTVFRMRAPRQRLEMAFEIMRSDYATAFGVLLSQPGSP
ncbi:MAG: hypothetical protein H0T54_04825 [Geodermatophilaceae bacterium]|nr:hypothetical protein [Geodermatophilaceae bacterium]